MRVRANPKPVNGIFTKDVVIDCANNVWLRVFTPVQEKDANVDNTEVDRPGGQGKGKGVPIILFYHGGGFLFGSPDDKLFDDFCRKIGKACNAVVISTNYRVAPKFPCPAAYDDCYKTFEWLRSPEARSHLSTEADISQCFLLGDSAGGNIVHFMGCRALENDVSPVQLRGMVELQPFFGGEELTPAEINMKNPGLDLPACHRAWRAFVPWQNRDHPNINVFGPNSPDISELPLPPILVVSGGDDILKDREATYVQKLQDMGKDATLLDYPGCGHGFYASDDSNVQEQMQDCQEKVFTFIRSHTR